MKLGRHPMALKSSSTISRIGRRLPLIGISALLLMTIYPLIQGGMPAPTLAISPVNPSVSQAGGAVDTIIYVNNPKPVAGPPGTILDLSETFIVLQIDFTLNAPGTADDASGTLISCVVAPGPVYPARGLKLDCSGSPVPFLVQRLMPRVYPSSNTGILLVGFVPDNPCWSATGPGTLAYTVSGIWEGAAGTTAANLVLGPSSVSFTITSSSIC